MMRAVRNTVISLIVVGGFIGGVAGALAIAPEASARCGRFLTFPAWYDGITNADCTQVLSPDDSQIGGIENFVWIIVLNVVDIMLQIVGYLAVFFIIYGGFQIMSSLGSPDKMAKGVNTVTMAVIGLGVAIASVAIKNLLWGITVGTGTVTISGPDSSNIIDAGNGQDVLLSVINTIFFVLGAAAVVIIILTGISYTTASGDASKIAKAKNTILYAVGGLVVAIAASAITRFIMNNL